MTSKLASLHGGLVARKGQATPALSNSALTYMDAQRPERESDIRLEPYAAPAKEQSTPPPQTPAPTPLPSYEEKPVRQSKPKTSVARSSSSTDKSRRKTAKDTHPGPYRLTFRMTHDQRRRLRIASAQKDRSLQQLLGEALDNYIDGLCACSLQQCACLAREEDNPDLR